MNLSRSIYMFVLAGLFCACQASFKAEDLTAEGLVNPLAIDNTVPHLSWKMSGEENGAAQTAYQIIAATSEATLNEKDADLWNTGKVSSHESVGIPYDGRALSSRSSGYWKVRIWNQDGKVSPWSETASFGVGFQEDEAWAEGACFIGVEQPDKESETSPLLRKKFRAVKDGRMLLHVNSLGYHEAYVNGQPVSDAVLNPAVSQFGKRTRIVTYDVTPLVHEGENEVVLWLGKGWYQTHNEAIVPGGPYVRAQLEAVTADGYEVLAFTDSSWKAAESNRRTFGPWRPHHMGGEIVDARVALPDLLPVTLDKLEWGSVKVADIPAHKATPQMCELNRIVETMHPVAAYRTSDGSYVYDFGTSFVGSTEIRMPVTEEGRMFPIYYEDYCLKDMEEFRDEEYYDFYIGNGKTPGVFSTKFNYKGYRYLKIKGLEEQIPLTDITGGKIRTDYRGDASFACSDEDMNAIYDMIHNTCHALTLGGYMVDCPQVERFGYGGDGNASTPTVQTLADLAPLYMNWIQAWADCQRENGDMPHTAPNPYPAGGGPFWCTFIIPASWQTWLNYGDRRLIDRYYPNMQRWIEYAESNCRNGLLQDWGPTDYRNWYLGDWATPVGINQTDPLSIDLVSNCVLSDAYATMSRIAKVLGRDDEAAAYAEKHDRQNSLIHKTFFDEEKNSYSTGTQIDLIYPMLVGATPDSELDDVRKTLVSETEGRFKGFLSTGLVGIPVITQWVTREGEAQWMYDMLKKREYPSYLYMIDNGATLTWEMWDGDRSQIHNCYNGIGTWFYQALAGISPDEAQPGYRCINIRPQMVDGITWVEASKDTPYGKVSVRWDLNGKDFTLNAVIPAGSSARITLPDGNTINVGSGRHELECKL